MYIGNYPWNTKLEKLINIDFINNETKQKMYLLTRNDHLYYKIKSLGFKCP